MDYVNALLLSSLFILFVLIAKKFAKKNALSIGIAGFFAINAFTLILLMFAPEAYYWQLHFTSVMFLTTGAIMTFAPKKKKEVALLISISNDDRRILKTNEYYNAIKNFHNNRRNLFFSKS